MDSIEERLFNRIIDESRKFREKHEKNPLIEKRNMVLNQLKHLMEEYQGEVEIDVKEGIDSLDITMKSNLIVDCKEAGTLLNLLKHCDLLIVQHEDDNVLFKMSFTFWEWVEKKD